MIYSIQTKMHKLRIFITGLILLSFILPSIFSVEEAMAQTKVDYLIGGATCVGSGILANLAVGWINKGLKALQGLVPKMFKFLNLEVPTGDDRLRWQREFGDTIGRCMARGMMNQMTARMIGAVRTSGRTGEPAFVRDWRRFKLNAQYRGENLFRAMLGSTQLCPYFSGDIKTLFNANNQPNINTRTMTRVGNLDPFNRRAGCTMPRGWDLQNYRTDFAGNGGWGALNRLAEPQNNYYGNLIMSMAELGVQRLTEEENDLEETRTALGFTSRREQNPAITTSNGGGYCLNNQSKSCTTNAQCTVASTGGNLPTTGTCIPKRNTCLLTASNRRCIVYSNILTPGSVLQQTATSVIQQELNWLTNVQNLQGFISDLTGLVLSRVLNLSAPDSTQQEPYRRESYSGLDDGFTTPPSGGSCDNNGICDDLAGEDTNNCPSDCGGTQPPGGSCDNNGVCEAFTGEDSFSCPSDCQSPPILPPNCGNGTIDSSEQCDGGNLNGKVCSSIGYSGGILSCNNNCTYNTSACTGLTLPDSTAAITSCNDGGSTPTNSNVCLTAQWFRQGQAGATDPSGLCATSNCVVLNHNIWDGSSDANIFYNGTDVFRLLGAPDYPNGTRTRRCITDGNQVFSLATNITPGFSLNINVPTGGSGTCP